MVEPVWDDDPSPDIETDFDTFTNYDGFDTDDEAFAELLGFVTTGKLRAYPTLEACTWDLGEEPFLSQFGLIVKTNMGRPSAA